MNASDVERCGLGYYWYREPNQPWQIVEVVREENAKPLWYVLRCGNEVDWALRDCIDGDFRGPLVAPGFYD